MLYRQSRAEVVIRGIRVKNSNISSFNGSPSREWRFSLFSEFQSVNIAHLFLLTCEMKRILLVIVFDEQEKWFLFPAQDWLEGKSAGSQLTYFVLKFCVYISLSYTNSGKSKGRRDLFSSMCPALKSFATRKFLHWPNLFAQYDRTLVSFFDFVVMHKNTSKYDRYNACAYLNVVWLCRN